MTPRTLSVPRLERADLGNGLRVVVVPDRSSPIVAVAVVYDVGFRSEPEGRTGFAHLFEHLMFEGSENAGKLEHSSLIEGAGGVMNGHTVTDVTAYYEALPAEGLELALWLEADRMARLALTEENLTNQVAVVEEEIKVNVLNRPYGGFPWIPLPAVAFDTFANSHNGYGDFAHLEEATLEDAAQFYATYYSPSNAVLCVMGDCTPEQVFELAERHFGGLEPIQKPPHGPFPEPPLAEPRRQVIDDPLVPHPAFAAGWRVPDPVNQLDDYVAYEVLGEVLAGSEASRLRQRLVHQDHLVTYLNCLLGAFGSDAFSMRDPVLFQVVAYHPGTASTDEIMAVVDEELAKLAEHGPTPEELERVAASAAADHWRGLDEVLGGAVAHAAIETVHGRSELLWELADRLAAVSAGEVAAAAERLVEQHTAIVELQPAGER